jgi:hypothetical protein
MVEGFGLLTGTWDGEEDKAENALDPSCSRELGIM